MNGSAHVGLFRPSVYYVPWLKRRIIEGATVVVMDPNAMFRSVYSTDWATVAGRSLDVHEPVGRRTEKPFRDIPHPRKRKSSCIIQEKPCPISSHWRIFPSEKEWKTSMFGGMLVLEDVYKGYVPMGDSECGPNRDFHILLRNIIGRKLNA
ncbi:hypothetical protein TNCV_3401151 [Trichonephila clavipes]|nr:hypothetical protein TNCV_3401151 [Trichonephila clavipes]